MNIYDDDIPVLNARFGRSIDEPEHRKSSKSRRYAAKGWRGRFVAPHPASSQRVVVKSQIKSMSNRGAMKLKSHVNYLLRDSASKADERHFFGRDPSSQYTETAVDSWRDDDHHFRFILSPEHGDRMDLERFTRGVVHHMEHDLGLSKGSLEWLAVEHHDTNQPHVHLLVRGSHLTARGKRVDLRIKSHYLHDGIRRRAREVATTHLGARSAKEMEYARRQALTATRLTQWDRELSDHTIVDKPTGDLLVHRARVARKSDLFSKETLTERLKFLETLQLAERENSSVWRVKSDFHERLKALGRHGDIVQAMWREKDDSRRWELGGLPKTHGLYRAATRTEDRFSDEARTILEGVDGRLHPLPPEVEKPHTLATDALVVLAHKDGKHTLEAVEPDSALKLSDYAGPTVLDRILSKSELFETELDPESDFAVEVSQALKRRKAVLAHHQIDPRAKGFLRDLRSWERADLLASRARLEGLEPVELGRGQMLRGHLSAPVEMRGSTYQILTTQRYLAVFVAAKPLREHADSMVEMRLVEGKHGRLRPVATPAKDAKPRTKDMTRSR